VLTIASAGYYRAAAADEHQCRRDTCERDHRLPGLDFDVFPGLRGQLSRSYVLGGGDRPLQAGL